MQHGIVAVAAATAGARAFPLSGLLWTGRVAVTVSAVRSAETTGMCGPADAADAKQSATGGGRYKVQRGLRRCCCAFLSYLSSFLHGILDLGCCSDGDCGRRGRPTFRVLLVAEVF